MTLADLLGRESVLRVAGMIFRGRIGELADKPAPMVPNVPFVQAIGDIVKRTPVLERDWREVARIYSEGPAFAMARSADLVLTSRIQAYIAKSLEAGEGAVSAAKAIADLGDFTTAYSETVYRTNVATAFSAGRIAQVREPEIKEVIPAFRYTATLDASTRPDHAAADGMIASVDSPVWNVWRPPVDYNCRCDIEMIDVFDLQAMGRIDKAGNVIPFIPSGVDPFSPPNPEFRVA
jgi:SPP1 gp7 family putative phage head morphogenesis protein